MPTPKLTKDQRTRILELTQRGFSQREVGDQVGCAQGSVSNVLKTLPPDLLEKDKRADRIDEFAPYHKEKFLALLERFKKWVGDTGKHPSAPKAPKGTRKKNAACNDLHAPFHNEEALGRFVRDNRDAHECWVAGDLFDLFAFSRYPKRKQKFSPVEEFQSGRAVLSILSEAFPIVWMMPGNHDERLIKYLMRCGVPPDIIEFFEMMYPGFSNPLHRLSADFENVKMMEPYKLDEAEYGHIHQKGDLVLSHAEKYSAVPNKSVGQVIEWLKRKAEPMGIVKPFRMVGQAHTHCAGKTWNDYGVVGIEMGCMARTPDYDGNPKIGGRQPVIGYTVFYQENGVTDINASNFIQLA